MADRLLYAVPTGRHPRMEWILSVRGIELTCRSFVREPRDFTFTVGPVQMARSAAAAKAVEGEYDYLLMHDDDLMVSPRGQCGNPIDVWHELMQREQEIGMVGVAYLGEHVEAPMAVVPHPDYPAEEGKPEEVCHLIAGLPYAPSIVAGVGTGFVMIRVSALKALRDAEKATGGGPPFKFHVRKNRFGATVEVGEDYDFCQRLRACGWKVAIDPRFETTHLKANGPLHYSWHDYEERFKGDGLKVQLDRLDKISQSGTMAIRLGELICLDHTPSRKRDGDAAIADMAEATRTTPFAVPCAHPYASLRGSQTPTGDNYDGIRNEVRITCGDCGFVLSAQADRSREQERAA